MSNKFLVYGGIYKNTDFQEIESDYFEQEFDTYEEAKKEWEQKSWSNVDDCHAKFSIKFPENYGKTPLVAF